MQEDIQHIINNYQTELAHFIRSRVSAEMEQQDILQEIWYQLSRKNIAEFKNVRAWLYQVARNKIIDLYRKKAPVYLEDYLLSEDGERIEEWWNEEETPEDILWREQFWEDLYEALESLPENQRHVFIENELEGKTLREIAENTNEKLKTIISRKRYAMQRLRTLLADWYEDLVEE